VDLLLFLVLVGAIIAATLGFIWIAVMLHRGGSSVSGGKTKQDIVRESDVTADSVFNTEFREELKNRGRLHFENVINENAMFLQQDLRLTTSQLNEFMKEEIKKVLKDEFATYEESISNAKDQAVDAIHKTQELIDEQRAVLEQKLQQQADAEKQRMVARFEKNMGEILNHYIIEAVGTEIDLSDQIEYIFANLEDNKQAILEDIQNGA
jgi:hypothetical protein